MSMTTYKNDVKRPESWLDDKNNTIKLFWEIF